MRRLLPGVTSPSENPRLPEVQGTCICCSFKSMQDPDEPVFVSSNSLYSFADEHLSIQLPLTPLNIYMDMLNNACFTTADITDIYHTSFFTSAYEEFPTLAVFFPPGCTF
ncbi:hypothetical protein BDR03DRAFT_946373 [Suillus americanus]|nr:hypothetical protein BDR03DRAFT_946373 [Suillus americanus]